MDTMLREAEGDKVGMIETEIDRERGGGEGDGTRQSWREER